VRLEGKALLGGGVMSRTMLAVLSALWMTVCAQAQEARPVTVTVDASTRLGRLPPVWRFFGADEPNYATMKDGRKLLSELGGLRPGQVYFRAHNLLSTGDGTPAFKWGSTNIYTEDAAGNPVYDYRVVDRIIDTYRERGIRPYLQIGFMPEALSTAPAGTPYQHLWRPGFDYKLIATGWTYPPKSYDKWGELIYQWTRHNVERYGAEEVSQWYFEVWNEANIDFYWQGTPEEFYRLHDVAIAAVRRALPNARVGGPDSAGPGGSFMDGFLEHVVDHGTPTDFLSFHAKGRPQFVDGHVRMGIAQHLKDVDGGFTKVLSVPALATRPVIIGESDPEGCAACPGPQNAYRNGTMYSSYTAASFARIWELAARRNVNLEGVLSWSFEFENQPWFAGYRQLATNGVNLPVLNVFRMFAMLGTEKIAAMSSAQLPLDTVMAGGVRGEPDVGVLATRDGDGSIQVLLWNYHDDDLPGADAAIQVEVRGMAGPRDEWLFRVDGAHANAFAAWKAMGSPQSPNATQYAELEKASELRPEKPELLRKKGRTATYEIVVPRQGVALLSIAAPLVRRQ
jgi:xylan 1,4-beta-xylosidase